MKAYGAQNEYTGFGTVVFAETAGKARAILIHTDCFEGWDFTEVRPYRIKDLDKEYKGRPEMDWCINEDRIALVKNGWSCGQDAFDPDDCPLCPAKDFCEEWEEYQDE